MTALTFLNLRGPVHVAAVGHPKGRVHCLVARTLARESIAGSVLEISLGLGVDVVIGDGGVLVPGHLAGLHAGHQS